MPCSFFVVKNLPIVDISAYNFLFGYDIDTNKRRNLIMRHVYIRGILALIWLVVALISGISGNLEMAALYIIIGALFLYSTYSIWKNEKKNKGEK